MLACYEGDDNLVQLLLGAGADVHAVDNVSVIVAINHMLTPNYI